MSVGASSMSGMLVLCLWSSVAGIAVEQGSQPEREGALSEVADAGLGDERGARAWGADDSVFERRKGINHSSDV